MFVIGWFSIGTFPSGIIALVVFSLFVWWRKRTANSNQDAESESDSFDTKQNWVLWLGLASLLFSFLTSIPALIIATRARPLTTRAKIGVIIAVVTLLGTLIVPMAMKLLYKNIEICR